MSVKSAETPQSSKRSKHQKHGELLLRVLCKNIQEIKYKIANKFKILQHPGCNTVLSQTDHSVTSFSGRGCGSGTRALKVAGLIPGCFSLDGLDPNRKLSQCECVRMLDRKNLCCVCSLALTMLVQCCGSECAARCVAAPSEARVLCVVLLCLQR